MRLILHVFFNGMVVGIDGMVGMRLIYGTVRSQNQVPSATVDKVRPQPFFIRYFDCVLGFHFRYIVLSSMVFYHFFEVKFSCNLYVVQIGHFMLYC